MFRDHHNPMKKNRHRLPKPVYECLPYFYIIAGAACVAFLFSGLAISAGLLLIFVGLVLIFQRYNYRSDSQAINQHKRDDV